MGERADPRFALRLVTLLRACNPPVEPGTCVAPGTLTALEERAVTVLEAVAVRVIKRAGGFLLAICGGFVSIEALQQGIQADMEESVLLLDLLEEGCFPVLVPSARSFAPCRGVVASCQAVARRAGWGQGCLLLGPGGGKPAHQQHFQPPASPCQTPYRDWASSSHQADLESCSWCPCTPEPRRTFQVLTALLGIWCPSKKWAWQTSQALQASAKGAARGERRQAALASRSGEFFLQVLQAAFKKLHHALPCPTTLNDFVDQVSFVRYFQRFGGFSGQKELGYTQWCLAHVMDCWELAWILTLLEEPPSSSTSKRST